jgi:hypothetical protein
MVDTHQYAQAQSAHDEHFQRYVWTAVAANGAGLLALAGIVGGVASPDTALRALVLPLNLFVMGVCFGSVAVSKSLALSAVGLRLALARDRADSALASVRAVGPAVSQMPMSLELAKLVHGDAAPDHVRRLYAEVVKRALERSEEAHPEHESAMRDQAAAADDFTRGMRGAMRWWNASTIACGLAFILAVNVVTFGGSLERPATSCPPAPPGKAAIPMAPISSAK